MARARRTVEITTSYRQGDPSGFCCFVSATLIHQNGQQQIMASRHITGSNPEQIIDNAQREALAHALELYLAYCEPF